jgi:hypothetical protein
MALENTLRLELKTVEDQPATDPGLDLSFFRATDTRTRIREVSSLKFTGAADINLPAEVDVWLARISPTRYQHMASGFFKLDGGEPGPEPLTVFRKPAKWDARFALWNSLPAHFDGFKQVLARSTNVKAKIGKKETEVVELGRFAEDVYDDVDFDPRFADKVIIAKAALLNLFFALTVLETPTGGPARPWFSFVEKILVINRERFIAMVSREMLEVVQHIHDNIEDFEDYRHPEDTRGHHGNLPKEFSCPIDDMVSIKSTAKKANIQLSLAPGKDSAGKAVCLLDADIDENGNWFLHFIDYLNHHFISGGTHPYDIHEYLVFKHRSLKKPIGYTLL